MSAPPQLPPLSAATIATGGVSYVEFFTADGDLYWLEQRPTENGRNVLVVQVGDSHEDRTPPGISIGSRVYEYGGSAVEVHNSAVYYVDKTDQRVYRQDPGAKPRPLTPDDSRRYGDLTADPHRDRLLAVCEDHRQGSSMPPVTIVAIPFDGGDPTTVVGGADFYASPRPSPDGTQLAFVRWQFPNMPWDTTELVTIPMNDTGADQGAERVVAGGHEESVCHPVWSPDGVLHFVTDRSDWWNISTEAGPVAPMPAEQGRPGALGRAPYAVNGTSVLFTAVQDGRNRLLIAGRSTGNVRVVDTAGWDPVMPRFVANGIAFLGTSSVARAGVFVTDADDSVQQVASAGQLDVDPAYLVAPESLEVTTRDGGSTYAYFYPPVHTADGPAGPAPLVVMVHGGPVGATSSALRSGTTVPQFWTSRGYAVVDVDYRGSTGHGRRYRQALYHKWGEIEVDDCIDVAEFLVSRGDAAAGQVVIRGGSAGGYTTLAALAFRDYFAAGTAYYPVSDLVSFHETTHKFEARYDEQLIGPWSPDLYRRRSPISRVADIKSPLLLVQGLLDRVCPPEQSELVVDALTELGRDVGYLTFADEAHGFTKADSIVRSLEAEADFYARVLGRAN